MIREMKGIKGEGPKILERKYICAMRGRNPENPSDRTSGVHTERRLEINRNGTSNCLTTVQKDNLVIEEKMESVKIKQATTEGSIECSIPGIFDGSYPQSSTRRGRVQDNGKISPTLTTSPDGLNVILEKYQIRKLTPRECARLMSFTDEDADAMLSVNSNVQVYKQCGNSIVTKVLEELFKSIM